jgi:peptide/nickel transport system permease protein
MLNQGAQQYMEQAPLMAVVPGIAIGITVFAINLFGDGLRDVLDPRLRGKGR